MSTNSKVCHIDQLDKSNDINSQIFQLLKYLKQAIIKYPTLTGGNAIIHKGILDTIILENKTIEAIWTNDTDGTFIYSNPPAGIANASIRDWFNQAKVGEIYQSAIYTSAITGGPCITVSMPIKDDFDHIVGIIGADLKIKKAATPKE